MLKGGPLLFYGGSNSYYSSVCGVGWGAKGLILVLLAGVINLGRLMN